MLPLATELLADVYEAGRRRKTQCGRRGATDRARTGPSLGFDATAHFKRSDFGRTAFMPAVSDEILVHITAEAIEAQAFAAAIKAAEAAAR